MNISEYYHTLAIKEKNNFLNFISHLGEIKLERLFKFPGEKFSLWWFSTIAEKSPTRTRFYERLIALLISSDNIQNHLTDRRYSDTRVILNNFLKGLNHMIHYGARAIKIKLNMKDFLGRRNALKLKKYIIVSYFPFVNEAKAEKGIFENKYFPPFHRILEEKYKDEYAHICIPPNVDNYGFDKTVQLANQFNKTQSLFFIEEFFKLHHLAFVIFYYLYFCIIFILNIKKIKKSAIYEYQKNKFKVWSLLVDDFCNSFCGENLSSTLYCIAIFRELVSHIRQDNKLICVCEMQWWEKVLYMYARRRGIATIGFQHTIISEMLLNYFNSTKEVNSDNDRKRRHFPDYLATVGNVAVNLFTKYGWPKDRVFVWGAQRFEEMKNIVNSGIPWQEKQNYFICTFCIDNVEIKKVLFLLAKAFKDECGYKILLKGHPASQKLEDIVKETGLYLNPAIFEIIQRYNLAEVLRRSKGIIVTESSLSLHALAYGIPIIVPRFINRLDRNPLSYISDIPIYAYSPDELRDVCNKIINSAEYPMTIEQSAPFLKEYLYFPEEDYEYLEKIDNLR